LVSIDHFYQFFESSFLELTQFLERINNLENIFLIGTVAPKRNMLILENISQDEYFTNLVKSKGLILGPDVLTSEVFRRRLYLIIQDCLKRISEKYGVTFIATSDESEDSENFLLPFYSAPDASHANAEYGAPMIQKIESIVGTN
jgi:hypothetical protein